MENINKIRFGSLERPKIKNEKHKIALLAVKRGTSLPIIQSLKIHSKVL